jgi:hypothetical protein
LLPTEYFHVVFTLPEPIASIAFYNKEVVYDLFFRATAETLLTIARDPQHLGVEIGFFAVLHSWGQNLHFHPHLHCVVPSGGLSADHDRWMQGRRRFLQHALPPGLQRIRYYGFLANCHRAEKLDLCRRLLAAPCTDLLPQPADCHGFLAALTASRFRLCPRCGMGTLTSIQVLWPCHGSASVRVDSS